MNSNGCYKCWTLILTSFLQISISMGEITVIAGGDDLYCVFTGEHNETVPGLAWNYNLRVTDTSLFKEETWWEPKNSTFGSFNCDAYTKECPGWMFGAQNIVEYLEYDVITDHRWNDLPIEILSTSKILDLTGQIFFTISFRASDNLNIVFEPYEGDQVRLVIDGWIIKNTSSAFQICRKNAACQLQENARYFGNILYNGRDWVTLRLRHGIQYNKNYIFILEDKFSRLLLSFQTQNIYQRSVEIHHGSPFTQHSLARRNIYYYYKLYTSTFWSPLFRSRGNKQLCVEVVYRMRAGSAFLGVTRVSNSFLPAHTLQQSDKWITRRFNFGLLQKDEDHNIYIDVQRGEFHLSSIGECKEYRISKVKRKAATSCENMINRQASAIQESQVQDANLYAGCPEGTFGARCAGQYSNIVKHYRGVFACNSARCTCLPGYRNERCNEACAAGSWGAACRQKCGRCKNNTTCNNEDGRCDQCMPGYQSSWCNQTCEAGMWGENCKTPCGACMEACDVETGNCSSCHGNFKLDLCTDCQVGFHGSNCTETCGNCLEGLCSKHDGICLKGCIADFDGPHCLTEILPFAETPSLAWISVVVFLLILLLVVGAFTWWRRRKRRCDVVMHYQRAVNEAHMRLDRNNQGQAVSVEEEQGPPLPARAPENKEQMSCIITDLGTFIDEAIKTNLLKKQYALFQSGLMQPCTEAQKPENSGKNRWRNVLPYDSTRVSLIATPGTAESDYINANFIDGYDRKYIATQAPKKNTIIDFWRLIWQEKISIIVMVTNIEEGGKIKCEQYWPSADRTLKAGNLKIHTVEEEIFVDRTDRLIRVSNVKTHMDVHQFHLTTWPDHGTPRYPHSVAHFLKLVIERDTAAPPPVLVHCSAGIGRTGTVILALAGLQMYNHLGYVDMLALLARMRSQRPNMVDNQMQFELAHKILLEILTMSDSDFPCDSFYIAFNALNEKGNLEKQFQKLAANCQREYISPMELPWSKSNKNRFAAIVPDALSRVELEGSDYINAVYVNGLKTRNRYIVTQLPLHHTLAEFWSMVFNQSDTILMLNKPDPNTDPTLVPLGFDEISIKGGYKVVIRDKHVSRLFDTVYLDLYRDKECHKITIYSINGWAIHEELFLTPSDLVKVWYEIDQLSRERVIVTCHDGATASGLFVAASLLFERIRNVGRVDVNFAVRCVRRCRPQFITSLAQFEFLHRAALAYNDTCDTYANCMDFSNT